MSAQTRIYVVSTKPAEGQEPSHRMVRALSQSQALRHVASNQFEVSVPTQDRLVELASQGVKVEEISITPQGE